MLPAIFAAIACATMIFLTAVNWGRSWRSLDEAPPLDGLPGVARVDDERTSCLFVRPCGARRTRLYGTLADDETVARALEARLEAAQFAREPLTPSAMFGPGAVQYRLGHLRFRFEFHPVPYGTRAPGMVPRGYRRALVVGLDNWAGIWD